MSLQCCLFRKKQLIIDLSAPCGQLPIRRVSKNNCTSGRSKSLVHPPGSNFHLINSYIHRRHRGAYPSTTQTNPYHPTQKNLIPITNLEYLTQTFRLLVRTVFLEAEGRNLNLSGRWPRHQQLHLLQNKQLFRLDPGRWRWRQGR